MDWKQGDILWLEEANARGRKGSFQASFEWKEKAFSIRFPYSLPGNRKLGAVWELVHWMNSGIRQNRHE